MQVESGVQMSSMHKGRKTCYDESRDGNIHAIKVNALLVPSPQQDLIGGTNNLDFQVILDQDPNVAEIHPLINGKPYGDEQSIPFISDDLRLFQTKASHMANAAKVSRQPLNDATKKQSWRQKKRKSQSGDRDGQGRREHRSAAIISHDESATAWAGNQDGRLVAIIKHTGASMGYDRNNGRQHSTSCAILMNFQSASITKTGEASPRAAADIVPEIRGTSDEMLNALIERIKKTRQLHHAPGGQAGNGNNHSGIPKERDDADDDAEKQEGDTKCVPIVDINAFKELVTTANKRVGATATNKQAAASTAEELIATTKTRVDPAREQVTTADGMVTATTSPNVIPDPENEAQGMSAAPIMGTSSAVLNDRMYSGSLGCQSTTTADCTDAARLQQPLPEHKDHVGGQEGGIGDAPIIDHNAAQEAGKLVQLDEEVSVRITRPYIKSTGMPPGCSRVLIGTPSGFQIVAPEPQMYSRTTIQPLGKLYKSYDTSPPGKQSGERAPCYEEHNAMLGITDYCVPDLNTSGRVETSINTLLPIPFADVQVRTRGLEPTNGGTVFPPEVLPPPSTTGRVERGIPPRFSSSAQEQSNGGTVCPSEVLPPAYTTGHVMRVVPPWLSPPAPEHVSTTTAVVKDCAALHAPYRLGSGLGAQEGEMRHIVTKSLVIHLVDIVCLTESQKLAHLIYLEQLTWIPINAGEAPDSGPEESMTLMIGVSRDVNLDPDKTVHIMHITVGTSAVHLVGKKSVMEFDMSLYEEDMGLLNQAGYIHILKDKGDVQYVQNWESL